MRGLLKIPEEKQIIKLCPFSSVELLLALESPCAEDTRGAADYQTFPIFRVDLLRALESPNVQTAENIREEADCQAFALPCWRWNH